MPRPMDNPMFPVVETSNGRIRGLCNTGVRSFRGIPYGENPGGQHRFQAPRPRTPWPGVRDCMASGAVAPQVPLPLTSAFSQLIHYELASADGGMSEDCLTLNVWTRGEAGDGRKRPLIVILHGGGYAHSSANAALYDGSQLALEQDVVVAGINHRLGSFGYLGLQALTGDARFADAGHAGLLDIVLALQWLRANAEAFGADPDCITLMGESGGGWKVTALMAMPAARGLFHRAIVQSGSGPTVISSERGAALAAALLAELGIAPNDIGRLLDIDFTWIVAAQAKIGAVFFQPVLSTPALPCDPLSVDGLTTSCDIPLIVSTTRDDAGLFFTHFDLDEAGLIATLAEQYGDLAGDLVQLYRAHRPGKSPYLLHAEIVTDAGFRRFAHQQCERRTQLGRAPTYMYRWDWPSPACDGLFGAAHAMDVSASLRHPRDILLGGGTTTGRRLAEALSSAIVAFATGGAPQTSLLPAWHRYALGGRECLLLNVADELAEDPDSELRKIWEGRPEPLSLLG